jgi:hypothetical protein
VTERESRIDPAELVSYERFCSLIRCRIKYSISEEDQYTLDRALSQRFEGAFMDAQNQKMARLYQKCMLGRLDRSEHVDLDRMLGLGLGEHKLVESLDALEGAYEKFSRVHQEGMLNLDLELEHEIPKVAYQPPQGRVQPLSQPLSVESRLSSIALIKTGNPSLDSDLEAGEDDSSNCSEDLGEPPILQDGSAMSTQPERKILNLELDMSEGRGKDESSSRRTYRKTPYHQSQRQSLGTAPVRDECGSPPRKVKEVESLEDALRRTAPTLPSVWWERYRNLFHLTTDEQSFYFYVDELTRFLHDRKWELTQDQSRE